MKLSITAERPRSIKASFMGLRSLKTPVLTTAFDQLNRQKEIVKDYLVSKGISSGRFTTKWYGETQPRESNETSAGKAKNRRIEIILAPNLDELFEIINE